MFSYDKEHKFSASTSVDAIAEMVDELESFRDRMLDMARRLCLTDEAACDALCSMEQTLQEMLEAEWSKLQYNLADYSGKELDECDWTGYEQEMPTHFPYEMTPAQLKAMIAKRNPRRKPTNPATLQAMGVEL